MKPQWTGLVVGIALFGSPAARAGFVITQNLPAGSAIIGVDGTADGAATYSGPGQDDWYSPFNTSGHLVEYTFQPGTYVFRLINAADAHSLFPSLTSAQLAMIGPSAWTYNAPWITQYMAWDISALTNSSEHQLFTGSPDPNSYGNATDAYAGAIASGDYDKIVTGSGRNTGTLASSYTFTTTQTLVFAVPDYYLPDNGGLVAFLVSPAAASVPEPSALALLGMGLSFLWLARFRHRAVRSEGTSR